MTCNDEDIPVTLDNDGGTLSFEKAGDYVLTAVATDELGQEFTETMSIKVYPVIHLTLEVPETTHSDKPAAVHLTGNDLEDKTVVWDVQSVRKTPIPNNLGNDGGEISFPESGSYTLTASVKDDLGREYTYEQTIEVYPVLTLKLTADTATHTDEQMNVSLTKDTSLPVTWKVTPSNAPDTATDYTGDLTDTGGTIQIATAGTYDIAASVTDATGRVFAADTRSVTVYPVAGLSFTLPAAAWTDSSTPLDLLTSDLQGQDVTWTLTKDGAAVSLTENMLGDLGNRGGTVRFPAPGTYALTASIADDLGREYSCTQTIKIYPVVALTVSTKDMSHTDIAEDVKLTAENLGQNKVIWTVLRDGVEITYPFELNASGGHGFFTEAGLYTFTATVMDELGRVATASDSIQIYPVGVSGFYLPKMFHTDSTVNLVTGFEELADKSAALDADQKR